MHYGFHKPQSLGFAVMYTAYKSFKCDVMTPKCVHDSNHYDGFEDI